MKRVEASQITSMARSLAQVRAELHEAKNEIAPLRAELRRAQAWQGQAWQAQADLAQAQDTIARLQRENATLRRERVTGPSPGAGHPEWAGGLEGAEHAAESAIEQTRHRLYD